MAHRSMSIVNTAQQCATGTPLGYIPGNVLHEKGSQSQKGVDPQIS